MRNKPKNQFIDSESLKNFIDRIIEEPNHHSRDRSFRFIASKHPAGVHENFEFPGQFVKALNTQVFTDDNRNLEMDYASLVNPDGFITTLSSVNVEHQTLPPSDEKIETMFYYQISLIHETNLISHSVIITHIDPGVEYETYVVQGQIFCIHYIVVDKEKISQRLSTLNDIVKSNRELSEVEALNFAYVAIFVHVDAKQIMEELAILFYNSRILNTYLRLDIFHVLKRMIKYHFQDDIAKTRELLELITGNLTFEEFDKLDSYEKTLVELDAREKLIDDQEKRLDELSEVIVSKDNVISEKDNVISEKDNVISKQNKEIKKLKELLEKVTNR